MSPIADIFGHVVGFGGRVLTSANEETPKYLNTPETILFNNSGPVYDVSQITRDPHIVEDREMFPVVHHPVIGDMHVNGDAIKLLETKPHVTRPAPTLGQDNEAVYGELCGLTPDQLVQYHERGII